MKTIPYASIVGSIMYAKICVRLNINFVVGILDRYESNPGLDHSKTAKKVLRYFKGTNDYKLMYKRSEQLELIGNSDLDFARCLDRRKSSFSNIYFW